MRSASEMILPDEGNRRLQPVSGDGQMREVFTAQQANPCLLLQPVSGGGEVHDASAQMSIMRAAPSAPVTSPAPPSP